MTNLPVQVFWRPCEWRQQRVRQRCPVVPVCHFLQNMDQQGQVLLEEDNITSHQPGSTLLLKLHIFTEQQKTKVILLMKNCYSHV